MLDVNSACPSCYHGPDEAIIKRNNGVLLNREIVSNVINALIRKKEHQLFYDTHVMFEFP